MTLTDVKDIVNVEVIELILIADMIPGAAPPRSAFKFSDLTNCSIMIASRFKTGFSNLSW
jgi:hypothetical protein